MTTSTDKDPERELDDLFDDIRQTCGDCEHPRCSSIVKSAKAVFASQATAALQPIPMVNGLDCPACGHPTLILGNGGYITCSLEGCPNPDYAEAATAAQEGAVDQIFIDIPTAHEITKIALIHENGCSAAEGFMCDCSVLKAAQYAVDKAKERLASLHKGKDKESKDA